MMEMLWNLPFLIHDPFIHIIDHLNVIAPNLMENPTGLKRGKDQCTCIWLLVKTSKLLNCIKS